LVQEHDEQYRKAEKIRKRRARKARDAYRALLSDLEAAGEISSKTTWQMTLSKIKDEPAYIELCGMQGSSPLDLWMDVVDDLGEAVQAAVGKVESALKKADRKVELGMSEKAFLALIKELGLSASVEEKLQKDVYQEVSHDAVIGSRFPSDIPPPS
jgi:pre-mRNA-processing factor 40